MINLREVREVRIVEDFLELLTPGRVWRFKPEGADGASYWKRNIETFVRGEEKKPSKQGGLVRGRSSRYPTTAVPRKSTP